MDTVAAITLVLAGLIIAAAALGLTRVVLHLWAVARSLDSLIGGINVIIAKTAPVPDTVASVNANLAPVRDFTESI